MGAYKLKLCLIIMNWCLILMDLCLIMMDLCQIMIDRCLMMKRQVPHEKNQCLIMMNLCLIMIPKCIIETKQWFGRNGAQWYRCQAKEIILCLLRSVNFCFPLDYFKTGANSDELTKWKFVSFFDIFFNVWASFYNLISTVFVVDDFELIAL